MLMSPESCYHAIMCVYPYSIQGIYICSILLGGPEVTANIYCKSRNLANTETQNDSANLR